MKQSYVEDLDEVIKKVSLEKENNELKLKKIEENLSDTKLNPYGVTSLVGQVSKHAIVQKQPWHQRRD